MVLKVKIIKCENQIVCGQFLLFCKLKLGHIGPHALRENNQNV